MIYILNNSITLLLVQIIFLVQSTAFYPNDYEPRVFDHIPLNCYDCLSYRDIILAQLTDVPARSFANFNLGSRDTYMILNGQLSLHLHPYAFQSLVVHKPNKTLTITLTAPNSWLNITENTFNGLELHPHSTLRIIINKFYGCTFHRNSLSGINMHKHSQLIIDISSVTEIFFEQHIIKDNDFNASVKFLITRSDTIIFDSYSFSQLNINPHQIILFHFELISHVYFKSYSFKSLELQRSSSFRFYSIFLNRLTMDSYAFENLILNSHSIFNFTIHTLGTCLCFNSYAFHNLHTKPRSENALILFKFYTLRGLSFFSHTFSNLSLNNNENQLRIHSSNPLNDPNPIINFAVDAFSAAATTTTTTNNGSIILNFSETIVIRFEKDSLKTNNFVHEIFLSDISFVDLSALNNKLIEKKFHLHFDDIQYVKWYKYSVEEKKSNHHHDHSLIQYHFSYISNSSCLIYSASRSVPWIFPTLNSTICNCPLLYAYKHDQLDRESILCLNSTSPLKTIQQMNECDFDRIENNCHLTIQSLTNLNNTIETSSKSFHSFELDNLLIQQLYDRNYLSCSFNYSLLSSTSIVRSRLFNHFGFVIGIILSIFIVLLVIVIALLNGLQYKMREYDETWTWKRNISWSTLRRTISQTSLRRSRRDLSTLNSHAIVVSKSDNQLDRIRHERQCGDNKEFDYSIKQSQSIQENFKQFNNIYL
ncbi:unnamed protein product [Rotaria socialis]|uniref:Uncharacterized protein n=1 Tax=Rotaria socialis TaxID=392032 RepID=A0A820TE92_9BILA|nr:unnamed protein product [Rotaria socialis]CAF4466610.1 unnamed protein product [Rotaria socialis]